MSNTSRNKLLGLLHMAIKRKKVKEQDYRDWLEKRFGVRSAANLTIKQLQDAVTDLRNAGWLDGVGRGSANGYNRPTPSQWNKLAALSREMGWNGLDTHGLKTFTKRIAKVDSPRFLNRDQARKVITGLQKWRNNIHMEEAK